MSPRPGWFGKLPCCGDFVSRRLPAPVAGQLDRWLSQGMAAAPEGAGWLEAYLRAPVLRFAIAPPVLDAGWWFGVLMPSCDSVGRYFPLVILDRRGRPPADRIGLDHLELWLDHLGAAALRTLAEGATLEGFDAEVGEAPPWPAVRRAALPDPQASAVGWRQALGPARPLALWLAEEAREGLERRLAGHTLWWRQDLQGHDLAVDVCSGLPAAERFPALLAGH